MVCFLLLGIAVPVAAMWQLRRRMAPLQYIAVREQYRMQMNDKCADVKVRAKAGTHGCRRLNDCTAFYRYFRCAYYSVCSTKVELVSVAA